jgi:glycosyltransferase involved in cell wall biosynthesis
MKRVLFLAYLFPPIANSGTQRPLKFAKYLPEFGWEPIVLTAAQFEGHHTDPGLLADIPEGVRVVRVPMLNEKIGETLASITGGTGIGRKIGDAIRWRMQTRRRSPDLYAWWQPTAVQKAMQIFNSTGFDAIYATGFPWTSLLSGCEVSRLTGRPLAADFRDLWAGENLFRSERPPHDEELAQEELVVKNAAVIVSASKTIGRQLAATHAAADESKFVTIHNGFDAADFAGAAPSRHPDRFRIVFTGVWKEGYNPVELYDSIDWLRRSQPALLDHVEVIAAGFTPGEAARRGLTAVIREVGVVPHDEAVRLMRSADMLYLSHVDPDRQWVVPGKLYEYLASGTPVLALTHPDRETAQIINAVGGGVAISPEDPGMLYQILADTFRTRRLDTPARNADALAAFERRQLTGRLATVLDDVISRAPAAVPQMTPAA